MMIKIFEDIFINPENSAVQKIAIFSTKKKKKTKGYVYTW